MIELSQVEAYFLRQPEVAAWPAMISVWQHYARNSHSWRLPELACQAVDGELQAVVPMITAVACSHISIVLVDDILDDDPKGLYRQLGAGVAELRPMRSRRARALRTRATAGSSSTCKASTAPRACGSSRRCSAARRAPAASS